MHTQHYILRHDDKVVTKDFIGGVERNHLHLPEALLHLPRFTAVCQCILKMPQKHKLTHALISVTLNI